MHWTCTHPDMCTDPVATVTSQKSRRGDNTPSVPARRKHRIPGVLLKFVMAVSGAFLLLYLVLHMIGNLKIFFGGAALDGYAAWLRTLLEPALPYEGMLWIVRVVLLVSVLAHIWSAVLLTLRANKARPVKYAGGNHKVKGSYAARTMRWGGVIIALFVVYHLLDLTAGTLNPNGVHLEVYNNVAADFAPSRWYVTLFYVLAVVAVGLHVRHGLWSGLQTLGVSNNRRERPLKIVSTAFAVVLTLGFLAVPIAVTFGVV
ncbi:succinate dehydrogenase / fumarate reductase cytochrome b subunit [Pseudonocardia sediminis]|uniref:Succinate dehydrogenase / fumarate reductase cytochrome b subunit n=1 Tax=Pseudonocardia sediminis TaxID=1397368 RepID=A0A4Q7UUY0_PSEST|nr:succinate dehydrogenase / fumarate reductase cytochrome b subunit [Pseudonocardia sediminis]